MEKKQPTYLETINSPLVPIGKVFGQELYIKLEGHNAAERDYHFMQVKAALRQALNLPPEVPPLEPLP